MKENQRVIIIGATSGIGKEMAQLYIERKYIVGIAGRRVDLLENLKSLSPERVFISAIDIKQENAENQLKALIEQTGGMDIYIHVSGIGKQNTPLQKEIEIDTLKTNAEGFTRMVSEAFRYFSEKGSGQIAVVSSIAGTKGLGTAPAYSATKRFQNCYIQCLAQLSFMRKLSISFTDIRPGFVDTELLNNSHRYPMLMKSQKVAYLAVKAIDEKKRIKIIDWRYAILTRIWRLIPNYIWERLSIHT